MKIRDLITQDKATLSFEVFPPKKDTDFAQVEAAATQIAALNPSYMSVTYGAGGSTKGLTIRLAEEIQKNTLQMSSALIEELVAERKYQKKTQQDIADITGILPANIARFENGSRVPTLVVLQKYASALGKRIKVELCDQEAK